MPTNQEMLSKVQGALKTITTDDLGASVLAREKRNRFIRTVSEATGILDDARQITMNSHTHDIDRIGFASRILQSATENQAPDRSDDPLTATNTLESVEVIAQSGVTDSTLEDNIEGQSFENVLLDLIADRVGIDLEELFLLGDRNGDTGTVLDSIDGWLVKSANEVVAGDEFATDNVESLFDSMIRAVPKKYLRDRSEWKFYVHWDIEDDYRNVLRERGSGLGDSAQTTDSSLAYKGIDVVDSSAMPEGTALLVPTSNLVYGIYRDITIEPDRLPKLRRTDFITTLRVDAHYEDENASVVATGYTGPTNNDSGNDSGGGVEG